MQQAAVMCSMNGEVADSYMGLFWCVWQMLKKQVVVLELDMCAVTTDFVLICHWNHFLAGFFISEFEQIPWFIFIVMVAQASTVCYLHIAMKLFLVESFWDIWIWFPEQLMTLISAAREHEIEFIYAISPGLDITFSNPKEVSTLKRKLDQVNVIWTSCSCGPTQLKTLQYRACSCMLY